MPLDPPSVRTLACVGLCCGATSCQVGVNARFFALAFAPAPSAYIFKVGVDRFRTPHPGVTPPWGVNPSPARFIIPPKDPVSPPDPPDRLLCSDPRLPMDPSDGNPDRDPLDSALSNLPEPVPRTAWCALAAFTSTWTEAGKAAYTMEQSVFARVIRCQARRVRRNDIQSRSAVHT